MEIVLWVVAGIVGLNAGLVAMAAILTAVREHRRRREIRTLERQWELDGVPLPDGSPALTPHGDLVRVSSGDRSPALTPHRRRGVPVTSKRGRQGPPPHRGTLVRSRPSRARIPGRRSLQVVVVAVVVCAGTALASSDAREVVSSALGAVARAFGLEAQPRPERHEPDGSVASQPETYVGVPRIGTDVGPVREQESVNAVETELPLPVGPDRETWPPTPPIPPGTEIVSPIPPDGLTAVSVSSTQIDLAWTDVVAETGYRIERSLDGETEWTPIGTTGQDVTTFSDVGLSPSTGYHYRVTSTNAGGDSPASIVASATTFTDPPSPPDALIAIAMSSSQIDLEWTDVATETGYSIERSLDGETEWTPIITTAQDVTVHSDTGLSPGTNYYYRVFATNAGGDSPTSSVASATTATDPPPSPPDFLTASSASSDQIDLEWNDVATETGYRIERSLDGETEWTPIGITDRDVTTYRDTGLSPGTSYFYRVIATNGGGDSHPSIVSPFTTTIAAQS